MKKLKTILQSRYLFKILGVIFFIYGILITNFFPFKSTYHAGKSNLIGTITKYKIDGNKLQLYIKESETIIVTYYFKTENEKNQYQKKLELGMKVNIEGELKKPSNNTVPNLFNYQKYLKNHHIFYLMNAEKIILLEKNTNVFYHLKNKIIKRIDQIDQTGYLKIFLLGDKSGLDEETLTHYQENGISHLFAISGMHISLIVGICFFFLNKITYRNSYKYSIIFLVLLFYLFLTNYSASVLRTTIMFFLSAVNKCWNLKIKKIDIMLLTLIVAIIINPFLLYEVGFQFSYLISTSLVIQTKKINKIKNKFLKSLYVSYLCFLISLPICLYYFYQVNFLSIFLNLIMIPLVSLFIFPLTLITFIFPQIYKLYERSITILEYFNNIASKISFLEFVFQKPSIMIMIVYYLLIILVIYHKKYLFVLFLLLGIHKNFSYLDSSLMVTVLEVGQGDAIFMKLPFNQGNILIDTGGMITKETKEWEKKTSDFSVAKDKIIPYLNSLGITKLEYLIITHGDYDHMGESIHLVNNFKVEKVIFNCGSYNDLEKDFIKVLEKKKIKYASCVKELRIDKYKLQFLNTKVYDNENDNSNVIYFNYNHYTFLFMGDAGIEKEEDIVNKYNLKNIDFLKVGHHGSNTSSNKYFIDNINPKYSFISVGKNNRYGHPKESVLDILSNSKIYRTDLDGSIEIKLNKEGYRIRTYNS